MRVYAVSMSAYTMPIYCIYSVSQSVAQYTSTVPTYIHDIASSQSCVNATGQESKTSSQDNSENGPCLEFFV